MWVPFLPDLPSSFSRSRDVGRRKVWSHSSMSFPHPRLLGSERAHAYISQFFSFSTSRPFRRAQKKKAKRRFLCVSAVAASLTTGSLFTTKEHGMRAFVLAEISQESCGAELHNYLPQLFGGTKDTHCKLGLAYPYRSNRPTLGGLCCFNFLGTEGPIAAI